MADYQGRLKVTLQGLGQIRELDDYLGSIEQRAESVRQAIAGIGAALKTNLGRRGQALSDKLEARQEVFEAERSVRSVAQRRSAQGRFLQGPGPNARRIAKQRLQAANIDLENAGLELKQTLEEKSYLVRRGKSLRRSEARLEGANALRRIRVGRRRERILDFAAESASSLNQGIRLGSFESQYQRRLQAFRRGGGGANAPELIEKVFEITQAYNVQKRIISATGDLGARVTRRQAAELSTLSASLVRYNEAQLEANRLARSRVERASGARELGDRLRPFEIASGTARDPKTGELLFPDVIKPPFPRRDVARARGLVNRAAKAAESGDQELFRLASFQAERIVKKLEAGLKAGLKNAPSSLLRGAVGIPGSPAFQARQLQEAIKRGGPSEGIKGRKELVGSPAYLEDQQRQLQRAIGAGGPKESIKGRKDLPGSPAYLEAEAKKADQIARLQRRDQERQARADLAERNRIARLRQISSPIQGTETMAGSPKYLAAQERIRLAQEREQQRVQRQAQQKQAKSGFFRGDARKAIGEGLIGGAFPLLFGQGVGASAGGLIGGVTGGAIGGSFGFGLSLVGTAVGQAVDTTAQNLKDLASALKSPNDTLAALEASGFRVSDSLKSQVEQLQSVGRAYDAQTLVLQEVEKRLGAGAAQELNALNAEQKKLQESTAILAGDLQRAIIPGIIGFTLVLRDVVDLINSIRGGRDPNVDFSRRNYRFNPFTGQLSDIGARDRGRLAGRVDQAIKGAPAREPLSPQEALAAETTRIQESRRIADQIQSAYREAFQLQRQAYDLQRDGADLNREIADYSYKKQREIFDLRQQVAEKEIENQRAAAQNRIERGDLNARQTFAAAVGFEQQLLSNVREVVRSRKEGEADIEQSRRKLELTMAKLNRDTEDYKRTNAREIEDIERRKLAYVRSVEDYRMRVADYVRDRARESADLMRQAMAQGEVGGAGGIGDQVAGYTSVSPLRRISYLSEIDKAAKEANIDPRLFAGLVQQESAFNPNARSSSGAIGLAQLMPGTARELGVDPFNIQENLRGGARYLRQMMDRFGLEGGLRAYNQGPGAQQRTPGGNSRESREYPGKVLANARALGFNPAAMPAPATMGGAAFGRTGRMSLREGYGMVDLRGSSREAIIADAADAIVNRAAMGMKTWIGGGGGLDIDATNLRGQALIAALQQGMRAHETRGRNPATAIDLIAKLGEPLGIPVGGISNRGGATGVAGTTARGTIALHLTPESVGRGATSMQAMAATGVGSAPRPVFNPVPTGPTPAAAPLNAAREMLGLSQGRGLQDAQRMLEEQNRLKQDGIELGQIEQILQSTQLPQLKQQGDALRRQIEARQQNLTLSDEAAAIADIQAEGEARLAQLLEDRRNALQKVQTQYSGDVERIKQVNRQAAEAIAIAKGEEDQRIKNVRLSNQGQNLDRGRAEILQLQEGLTLAKVEAAALERGELQASNVELFKASALYEKLTEQQKQMAEGLVAQTEELRKQSEFRKQMNELDRDTRLVGAGLGAGMVGAPARAFEEGLKRFDGDVGKATEFANQTKLFENQQLVWQNLEKNIVDVSDAISGALTNGLLDIISGAREIEDVGRDMLNGIARSFADSAQQQLTTLMQRQLAQFAGPKLAGMLGAGAEAAGPQALGLASLTAAGQVAAFGAMLQTVMGQMALSGAMGGFGSAPSLLGSALPDFVPGLSPTIFGGFLANGGTTRPGEAYVVGDGGEPEFFFPGVTGRVVPQSDMQKAAALREESETDQGPIDVRYTVTEQAGQRYVTEEQFRKGMAETAKRSYAMTKTGLRNNKNDRDYVGI